MSENLFDILFAGAAPESIALETPDGTRLSYAALAARAAGIAAALQAAGVAPGDRVAAQVEKSADAVALYLATLRAGAVFLPLNTAYTRAELAYFLSDADPALAVGDPESGAGLLELAAAEGRATATLAADGTGTLTEAARTAPATEPVPRDGDDLAAILYTSGTTGRPKGAMLSHANLASNAAALVEAWRVTDGDVLIHALPIFHVHGLFVALHTLLMAGGRILLMPRFDAAEVAARLPRATMLMGVPTFYSRLLQRPELDAALCASMRLFVSGSAPLLESTHADFAARTGHAILERYGMTETGMNTSNPYDGARRPGTVGPPLPGVELRVREAGGGAPLAAGEVGAIEVRGPNVFRGYWRNPEKTRAEFTEDGFFVTGDLGCVDADGYVRIVGRARDLIISGGYNVYPKEVESEIDALPGVAESAVIGLADPDMGETVCAVVVAADRAPDAEAITAALRGRLAPYKLPRRIVFEPELPRNTMGKVQKAALRERYGQPQGA